jgi:hypothetical protein
VRGVLLPGRPLRSNARPPKAQRGALACLVYRCPSEPRRPFSTGNLHWKFSLQRHLGSRLFYHRKWLKLQLNCMVSVRETEHTTSRPLVCSMTHQQDNARKAACFLNSPQSTYVSTSHQKNSKRLSEPMTSTKWLFRRTI